MQPRIDDFLPKNEYERLKSIEQSYDNNVDMTEKISAGIITAGYDKLSECIHCWDQLSSDEQEFINNIVVAGNIGTGDSRRMTDILIRLDKKKWVEFNENINRLHERVVLQSSCIII